MQFAKFVIEPLERHPRVSSNKLLQINRLHINELQVHVQYSSKTSSIPLQVRRHGQLLLRRKDSETIFFEVIGGERILGQKNDYVT